MFEDLPIIVNVVARWVNMHSIPIYAVEIQTDAGSSIDITLFLAIGWFLFAIYVTWEDISAGFLRLIHLNRLTT